ncbi:DUF6879 family protein [Amycolatopsis nigrescens]|uniref:DUF6879 family protein n=1 Tax=Amycolatopsis nigrescens TaxID=381445 RepID=UPI000369F3C9|nr:DUF6879 family protein [Amycolatopsis nigrescens]
MLQVDGSHEIGGNWISSPDYMDRMSNFKRSSFRFQTLQVYGIPHEQESFREFLKTGVRHVDPNDPRLVRMRNKRTGGRITGRVQVVHQPISDYLRHTFGFFHVSAEQGENLGILDTSTTSAGDLPDYDFVLLDDETVIKLHYSDEDGSVVGRELLPEADIAQYQRYRDYATENSVPFLEYERSMPT